MTAFLHFKCPYVNHDFKFMDENKIDAFVMNAYVKRIIDCKDRRIASVDDIDEIIEQFSSDGCMPGEFFEAKAAINGKWLNVTPSLAKVFEILKERNLTSNTDDEEEEDDDDEDGEDDDCVDE